MGNSSRSSADSGLVSAISANMEDEFICYTYKIYDIGYKTEMMSKECNAGDPLETPGGLYRGPPSNGLYNI